MYRKRMRLPLLLCLTLAASPAFAGATQWQEIAPGVRARLISADSINDGTSLAGLELDLAQGTNTYWRLPGETGIPTELSFAGSTGVGEPTVSWPFPEIDQSKGYVDYIYRGHMVLPIALRPDGKSATLAVRLMMGVCSDMCVPASTSLSLPIVFDKADPGQSIRLDQAEAAVPIPWDRPGQPVARVTANAGAVTLDGLDPQIDPASIIAETEDPAMLFRTPQKSPDSAIWTLRPLGGADVGELEGRTIRLTFNTPSGPYTVSRQIMAAQ
jgi:DsbC/DsbD-like thiol-disulfide interchange protein